MDTQVRLGKDRLELGKDNINNIVVMGEEIPEQPQQQKIEKFVKPTIEEIKAYCKERNNGIDANYFFDYYESKGWLVGKTKMKSWKAAVRTWERKEFNIVTLQSLWSISIFWLG